MTPWERAISFVLEHEGGYSNDPKDPGGRTKYGISQRAYPDLDIANLTQEDAKGIYRRDYWAACKCDHLPSPLAILVMDTAVNQGVVAASRMLQEAIGVAVDGVIGTATLAASRSVPLKQSVPAFMALRCQRYAKTKNVDRYGKGWFRRAAACLMTALEPL